MGTQRAPGRYRLGYPSEDKEGQSIKMMTVFGLKKQEASTLELTRKGMRSKKGFSPDSLLLEGGHWTQRVGILAP